MKLFELDPGYLNKQLKPSPNLIHDDEDDDADFDQFKDFIKVLESNRFKLLGKGVFAAVYSREDLPYVIKIPFDYDEAWYKFAEFCIQNKKNKHLPKIKFLEKWSHNNLFVSAIEKLQPITISSTILDDFMAGLINESFDLNQTIKNIHKWYYRRNLLNNLKKFESFIKIYKNQLIEITNTIKKLHKIDELDLHAGNFMMRNNTIVITDPLITRRK